MSLPVEMRRKILKEYTKPPSRFFNKLYEEVMQVWDGPMTDTDLMILILTPSLNRAQRNLLPFPPLSPPLMSLLIDTTPPRFFAQLPEISFTDDTHNTLIERARRPYYFNDRTVNAARDRRVLFLKAVNYIVPQTDEEAIFQILNVDDNDDFVLRNFDGFGEDVMVMALLNTDMLEVILEQNLQRPNFDYLVNIALMRVDVAHLEDLADYVTTDAHLELYEKLGTATSHSRALASIDGSDLMLCDPTCIISRLELMDNPAPEQLLIGMIRSTTNEIFMRHAFTPESLRYYVLRAKRLQYTPAFATLPPHLEKIAFMKCPELYTIRRIPRDYRYLVFHTFDAAQIQGYFLIHHEEPTERELAIMVSKGVAEPWFDRLPPNLHQAAIARCSTLDELSETYNTLPNPSAYITYITLIMAGTDRYFHWKNLDGAGYSIYLYYQAMNMNPEENEYWLQDHAPSGHPKNY